MRTHRFFLTGWQSNSTHLVTDADLLHQWLRVFRMEVGDALVLCNGKNQQASAKIINITKTSVQLQIGGLETCTTELKTKIILACALLKRENFEWVVQKATELGVAEIHPLLTDRTVKEELKRARLEKIVTEAMEQSGRGVVPIIREPLSLKEYLSDLPGSSFLFDAVGVVWSDDLIGSEVDKTTILIGPEGGWSDSERKLFVEHSLKTIRLGSRTLRAETAAVAALTLVTNTIEKIS